MTSFGIIDLDPAPFRVGNTGDVIELAGVDLAEIDHSADVLGYAFGLTADPQLRDRCDAIDGIASRLGLLDTIVYQPMGSTRMVIGFSAMPGALGRAMNTVLGPHSGQAASHSTAVIVGSGAAGACAIAALVQHKYDTIAIAATTPGLAVSAAHRMDIDADFIRPDDVASMHVDLLVNTVTQQIVASPRAVCDLTGSWDGFTGAYVSPEFITAHQRQDQIRALTGKTVSLKDILAAL